MTDVQGNIVREYPRLHYGGAHLVDESQRDRDVLKRALHGALAGLLVGALLVMLAKRWTGQRAVFVTILFIAPLIGAIANLATMYHVLGTDKVGQDVLYLSLKSIRTGLIIGTVTTLVTLPLSLFLGVARRLFPRLGG